MSCLCHEVRTVRASPGFSYVEVLVALVLLAVGIVPATDAVRNSLAAPQIVQAAAQSRQCVKNHMEKILAEPYQNLAKAAGLISAVSAVYSLPADTQCDRRNVYVSFYNPGPPAGFVAINSGLLYVTVAAPGTAQTFSTLLAQ